MKNLLFLLIPLFVFSQQRDPRSDQFNFVPGELIVKLKDDVDAGVVYASVDKAPPAGKLVAKNTISKVVSRIIGLDAAVKSQEVLFSKESVDNSIRLKQQKTLQRVQQQRQLQSNSSGGSTPPAATKDEPEEFLSLKNVVKLELEDKSANILELVEKLKDNPNIEYIEPNYIFSINDFEIASDIIYDKDLSPVSTTSTSVPDDPLYSQQTNITQTNIDDVWNEYTTGDGSQIVAILDTGVDYTHPDLEANIWINEAELNGVEGYDDDGNGYVDDIRGWDFFNEDNEPLDDNMHGTHVAGIVGAVGGNGIGVTGAAWNVKLMPLKVLQASGSGNSTGIAAGIAYATNNGATVLNMSFTGGHSVTIESALALAYQDSARVLVAATGNNSRCTDGVSCGYYFPAGYPFVMGVATTAGFSNYDNTGPYYSPKNDWNYELIAPGVDIISTVPNGGYAQLSGTSMAAPLVAGSIALYNQVKQTNNNLVTYGDFINSGVEQFNNTGKLGAEDVFDLLKAIEIEGHPLVKIYQINELDDNENNVYQNGTPNAGEIIDIYVSAKNFWSTSGNISASIEVGGNEFQNQYWSTLVNIDDSSADLGTLSDYSSSVNITDPFTITLNEDIIDGIEIEFIISIWDDNYPEKIDSRTHTLTVTNMITLEGSITSDSTLEEGSYLIDSSIFYVDNAVLTIMPGTKIYIRGSNTRLRKINNGKIIANGTKDKRITFYNERRGGGPVSIAIDECTFCNFYNSDDSEWRPEGFEFYSDNFQTVPSTFTYCDFGMKGNNNGGFFRFYSAVVKNSNLSNFIDGSNGSLGMESGPNITNPYSGTNGSYYIDSNGKFYNKGGTAFTLYNSRYNNFVNYNYIITKNSWGYDYVPGENGTPENELAIDNLNSNIITTIDQEWVLPFGATGTPNFIRGPKIIAPEYSNWSTKQLKNLFHIIPHDVNYFHDFIITDANDSHYVSQHNSPAFISTDLLADIPYSEAPGFVWKIELNNKILPAQLGIYQIYNEYIIPEHPNHYFTDDVGVGNYELKVYFNREMDTSVDPQISYGVMEPYNQKTISEQGTWSADGKIYTVNHEINIGSSDGINRIIVSGVKDLNNFDLIPCNIFKFNLQSAGSASTGFMATAGLGEITLDWTAPLESDLDDVLGYNMYRYTANEDGTFTDPVKINESLITDITFKDYDLARDTQYFYKYKILRTSFEETDYSNAVSSQLLTAALGDSNGDSSVNVMDVVNTVDYILGNNPTPFVDYATDVNNDSSVNVLDVVGIVDMILNPTTSSVRLNGEPINYISNALVGEAELFWRDNDLYVKTDKPILGLQLSFDGDLPFTASELFEGYELNNFMINDKRVVMAYSFDGFQITPGTHKLLTTSNKPLDVTAGAMATSYGESIFVLYNQGAISHIDAPLQTDKLEVLSVSPNPSNGLIKLHYYLPEQMDNLSVGVFDLSGRLMWNSSSFKNTKGHARASLDLQKLSTGTYIMMINANRSGETKFNHTAKIVIE